MPFEEGPFDSLLLCFVLTACCITIRSWSTIVVWLDVNVVFEWGQKKGLVHLFIQQTVFVLTICSVRTGVSFVCFCADEELVG